MMEYKTETLSFALLVVAAGNTNLSHSATSSTEVLNFSTRDGADKAHDNIVAATVRRIDLAVVKLY